MHAQLGSLSQCTVVQRRRKRVIEQIISENTKVTKDLINNCQDCIEALCLSTSNI